MAQNGPSAEEVGRRAERAARKANSWIERLARVGYAAYGVVYVLVGVLAVHSAFGGGGQATGQEGALRSILLAPLGRILLGIVVVGLLAYAMWRLFQGILDPENEGRDAKGVVKRFDHVINGLFHAALAFSAGQVALGVGGGGGGSPDEARSLGGALHTLARQPFGPYILGAVAFGLVAYGVFMFVMARYRRIEPA